MQKMIKILAAALGFALAPVLALAQDTSQSQAQPVVEQKVEVKQLTDKTFDAELKNAKVPVLVDFTAIWCGPCQRLKPKLDQLAQEFKGKVIFTKVEQTQNPGLVQKQGVGSFPTVKIYAPGGKELDVSVGDLPIKDLRNWIQQTLDDYNKSLQPQQQPQKNGGN